MPKTWLCKSAAKGLAGVAVGWLLPPVGDKRRDSEAVECGRVWTTGLTCEVDADVCEGGRMVEVADFFAGGCDPDPADGVLTGPRLPGIALELLSAFLTATQLLPRSSVRNIP